MTDLLGSLDQETLRRKRRQFEAEKQELEIKVKKGVLQALKKHFHNESDEEILTNHGDVAKKAEERLLAYYRATLDQKLSVIERLEQPG